MAMEAQFVVRKAAEALLARLRALESLPPEAADDNERFQQVKAAFDACLEQLGTLGLVGPDNRLPSSELWNIAGEVLQRGWMQNQARTKPRGYAGDYEMLSRMYQQRLCDDPLGRQFDRYFQEEAAPRAVRNRMAMMAEWIVEVARKPHGRHLAPRDASDSRSEEAKIAVVGSAFGLEVHGALTQLSDTERGRVFVTLMDLDWAAIEFAKQQLAGSIAPERLNAVSANLFRLPTRAPLAAHLNDTDLLLCPGIFDYLDDAAAAAMLRTFWEKLAPGGRMAVFQFAPHNPTRAYMEWLGNWYLIYRTSEQLRQLAIDAGIPLDCVELGSEPLGVDLLLVTTRKGSARRS